MNSSELRNVLLTNADELVKDVVDRAMGKGSKITVDAEYQRMVWDAIIPIVQSATDREKIDAKNAGDVLKLLSDGKLSINDTLKLLEAMHLHTEIELTPKLLEELEKLNGK